jgi:hypothetical protein
MSEKGFELVPAEEWDMFRCERYQPHHIPLNLKRALSDMHSLLTPEQWEELEPETKEIALAVHTELHHAGP